MSSWQRTFTAVWIANFLSGLGMMSFLPFFPSLLEQMGLTERGEIELWAGLCFGGAPLMAALMGPVWGSLGDRFGRKPMVLRSLLAITVFVGAMSLARTPLELFLLRLLQGTFSGILPPSLTLVSLGAPNERQGSLAGRMQMAMASGAILGPALGGWAASVLDLNSIFLGVSAVVGLGAMGVAWFAEEPDLPRVGPGVSWGRFSLIKGVWADFRALLVVPSMRPALAVLFCVQFGIGATNPVLELFVRDLVPEPGLALGSLRFERSQLTGLLFSATAILHVFSMPGWGRRGDERGHLGTLFLAAGGVACSLLLCGLAPLFGVLLLGRAALGFSAAGTGPTAFGVAAVSVAAENRGAANGAVFSARALALALSSMLGGALAAVVGVRGLFFAGALAVGLAVLGGWALAERPGPPAAE
jgi:DHA1 family multidrug resistance protein-like MFS transporter